MEPGPLAGPPHWAWQGGLILSLAILLFLLLTQLDHERPSPVGGWLAHGDWLSFAGSATALSQLLCLPWGPGGQDWSPLVCLGLLAGRLAWRSFPWLGAVGALYWVAAKAANLLAVCSLGAVRRCVLWQIMAWVRAFSRQALGVDPSSMLARMHLAQVEAWMGDATADDSARTEHRRRAVDHASKVG